MSSCGACGSIIMDHFMECSNGKCKKLYDLVCLELNIEAFKSYTEEYKSSWVCPECICLMPKRGNTDTPLIVRTPVFKTTTATTTPMNNINTQRGSQASFSPTMDSNSMLLEELREFRSEMTVRMNSQAEAITLLLNQFSQTRSDLDKITKLMIVLEEKVYTKQTQDISDIVDNPPSTFAEVVSQQNSSNSHKTQKLSNNSTSKTQKVNKGGATKTAVSPVSVVETTINTTPLTSASCEQTEIEEGNTGTDWTTVIRKKNARPLKNVALGTNKELKAIQATERKKHLHVWRLHPETTTEAITDHVKTVCGPDVQIKVDKINHKTKRDYSSFIIGVPEVWFQKLHQSEIWPMNAEFNEWIWFRNSTKNRSN